MTIQATPKVEMAFGVSALSDTSWFTTGTSTNTGNLVSTPYSSGQAWSTKLDLRMKVALSDWTPGSSQTIFKRYLNTDAGFLGTVNSDGTVQLTVFDNTATSMVAAWTPPPFVDGKAYWLRFVCEYGSPTYVFKFYISTNGTFWTEYRPSVRPTFTDTNGPQASTEPLVCYASDYTQGSVTFYHFAMFADSAVAPVAVLDMDDRWATTNTTWTDLAGNIWTQGAAVTAHSVWADISADILHSDKIVTTEGRSTDLDKFQPSTSSFTLKNDTRKYDPTYSSGAYFGKLLPRTPCRIRAQYNGVVYPLHRGVVTGGFNQAYDPGNTWATVPITTSDEFTILTNQPAVDSAFDADVQLTRSFWNCEFDLVLGAAQLYDTGLNGLICSQLNSVAISEAGDISGSSDAGLDFTDTAQRVEVLGTPFTSYPLTMEFVFQTSVGDYFDGFTSGFYLCQLYHGSGFGTSTSDFSIFLNNFGVVVSTGTSWSYVTSISNFGQYVQVWDGGVHHMMVTVGSTGAPSVWIDGQLMNLTHLAGTNPASISAATNMRIGDPSATVQAITVDRVIGWNLAPTDAVGDMASRRSTLRQSGQAGQRTDQRIAMILEAAGWQGHRVNSDAGSILVKGYVGGGVDVLDYIQTVESTEYGALFMDGRGIVFRRRQAPWSDTRSLSSQATYSDDNTGTGYLATGVIVAYDDKLLYNQAQISNDGGVEYDYADPTSVALYGAKSFSSTGLVTRDDTGLRELAEGVVYLHKDIAARVDSVALFPENNASVEYPQALGSLIGDRITVKRQPQGVGSSFTLLTLIEGVRHELDSVQWTTTLLLNSQTVRTNWFTWGTSTWGGTDVWSF